MYQQIVKAWCRMYMGLVTTHNWQNKRTDSFTCLCREKYAVGLFPMISYDTLTPKRAGLF